SGGNRRSLRLHEPELLGRCLKPVGRFHDGDCRWLWLQTSCFKPTKERQPCRAFLVLGRRQALATLTKVLRLTDPKREAGSRHTHEQVRNAAERHVAGLSLELSKSTSAGDSGRV